MPDSKVCPRCLRERDERKFPLLEDGRTRDWCLDCNRKPGRKPKPATESGKARAIEKVRRDEGATGDPCGACTSRGALRATWRGEGGAMVAATLCTACRAVVVAARASPDRMRALAAYMERIEQAEPDPLA